MTRKLPKRPNLDHLRRQAKVLLATVHEGDDEAARTLIEHLPEAKKLTPARVRAAGFRLADAQSAIARQTGFASWPALSRHVHTLKMLEGEWRFESLEIDGAVVPGAGFAASRILIDGDCFRTESPEATYEGAFTIDVEAVPSRIDIEFVEGPEAGNWSYGLFEVDQDEVTFCLGLAGSSRPSGFVTSAGSGHALERLRRAAAARPTGVDGGAKRPAAKPDRAIQVESPLSEAGDFDVPPTPLIQRLAGEWACLELIRDGETMNADWLPYGSRTTVGNEVKVVFGGQTMLHARMRLHEAEQPTAVDYLNLSGANKGRISLGIMEFCGDDVTFLIAPPGRPRPAAFVCGKGSGSTLSRWRRKP